MRRGCKGLVAAAPLSAASEADAVAMLQELAQKKAFAGRAVRNHRPHDGPHGRLDGEILRVSARAVVPPARASILGSIKRLARNIPQGAQVSIGLEVNTAASSTVTSIGPAPRDVLFAAEADTAISPRAAPHSDDRF